MKSTFNLLASLLFIVVFASACRDKGAYTYSGVLLDSCLNPIKNASIFIDAGQTGDGQTYSDQNGYFKISGVWDERGGFVKSIQPTMDINFDVNGRKNRVDFEFLPEGNIDLKRIVLNGTLALPVVVDRSDYDCANCTFEFWFVQDGTLNVGNNYFSDVIFNGANPTYIRNYMPLQLEWNDEKLASDVYLYFSRTDSVRFVYPEIKISEKIKFCSTTDTIFIKL